MNTMNRMKRSVVFGVPFLVLGIAGCGSNASEADGTDPTAASTRSQASPLSTGHRHVPAAVTGGQATPVGAMPAAQDMHVTLVVPPRDPDGLTRLVADVADPASPHYRQYLSVAEFADRFGPTEADYQNAVAFATANGLTVTESPANRLTIPVHGTVAQVERTLKVNMKVYQHPTENRTFYSADREPTFDAGVSVSHVAGLDNYVLPRRATRATPYVNGSGPNTTYLGTDMRAAYYGGQALTGSGQVVGLFQYGGFDMSDVAATFSTSGQAYAVPINKVVLDGMDGNADGGDDGEQIMDIAAVVGMAPGLSQVRVYIGNTDVDILNKIVSENLAKATSCSWTWGPADPASIDPIFQEMAVQGQSFYTASGDDGSVPTSGQTYFPSHDAYITSVGGTAVLTSSTAGPWASETAWSGTGGGFAPTDTPIPSWQVGVANASNGASTTLRNFPDVAADADGPFYFCHMGGVCTYNGGTSLATPLWAGYTALINQQAALAGHAPLGFGNPAIYALGKSAGYQSAFHDITSGSNGAYNAVSGYDLVTGWGSPNGQGLIDALAGLPAASFTLSNAAIASGVSVPAGGTASTTIHVNDLGGFSGSVTLAVSGLPAGVTASFGTDPTTQSSVLTLSASSSASPGVTNVTVTGTSGSRTTTTAFVLTVAPPTVSTCHIDYTAYANGNTAFNANVYITNTGSTPINNWTLAWTFANGQTVTSLWNGIETQSGPNVTVSSESYNAYIPAGADYRGLGFNGTWNGVTNAAPTSITLNGAACTIN